MRWSRILAFSVKENAMEKSRERWYKYTDQLGKPVRPSSAGEGWQGTLVKGL